MNEGTIEYREQEVTESTTNTQKPLQPNQKVEVESHRLPQIAAEIVEIPLSLAEAQGVFERAATATNDEILEAAKQYPDLAQHWGWTQEYLNDLKQPPINPPEHAVESPISDIQQENLEEILHSQPPIPQPRIRTTNQVMLSEDGTEIIGGSAIEGRLASGRSREELTAMTENLVSMWENLREATATDPHPNLARVYQFSQSVETRDVEVYYVRENGIPEIQASVQQPFSSLPRPQQISMLEGLFKGISHLHQHDIIHRDITPDNIIRTEDGRLVLTDYELANKIGDTINLVGFGNREYYPREILYGSSLVEDPLSESGYSLRDIKAEPSIDVYSLAITTAVLLDEERIKPSGNYSLPRNYPATFDLYDYKNERKYFLYDELYSSLQEHYGATVADALRKATTTDSKDRYQTVEEFWQNLKDALS